MADVSTSTDPGRPTKASGWFSRALSELLPGVVDVGLSEASRRGWSLDRVGSYCGRCGDGTTVPDDGVPGCRACRGKQVEWDRFVRIDRYAYPMRDWIVAMKFGRAWSWAPWFGRTLADRTGPCDGVPGPVVVCPVPMHWRRRIGRGYNQSRLMAEALAKRRGWMCQPLLRRVRYTPPQTTMSRTQRLMNVRRSIHPLPIDLSGWDVWIVDDVKTTGTTMQRCARLIRRAGARTVNVAVAAVAGFGQDAGSPASDVQRP